MKIIIEIIPHKRQNYPTAGDWRLTPKGELLIRVSEEMGLASCGLVAIHELAEVFQCFDGFRMGKQDMKSVVRLVDAFDKKFEGDLVTEEPGDDPRAPYHRAHSIATAIERILCAEIGIAWKDHDDNVARLFE
ncbi:MAG TPA: hypothetical protein VMQ76_05665 [Terracidiphilus sp.]|nr:hypothetical protein [Terracidiphilus sp.]